MIEAVSSLGTPRPAWFGGGPGVARLYGKQGNDHLYGDQSDDLLDGGSGNVHSRRRHRQRVLDGGFGRSHRRRRRRRIPLPPRLRPRRRHRLSLDDGDRIYLSSAFTERSGWACDDSAFIDLGGGSVIELAGIDDTDFRPSSTTASTLDRRGAPR